MPFTYPDAPHARQHAPAGYTDYTSFKPWLRDEFAFRCVFCLMREMFRGPEGQDHFAVEHLAPQVARPDLTCVYTNLVYACLKCNSFKGDRGPVPDPCATAYGSLLRVDPDGTIHSMNEDGRVLLRLLRLDRQELTTWRRRFLELARLVEAEPISDLARRVRELFGYPSDMPDLRSARPPRNDRSGSADGCHFARRERGQIAETY